MKTLVCEICQQKIATFDPKTIKLPLRGDMFGPAQPGRGMPPPFDASLGAFDFRCYDHIPFAANFNTVADTLPERFPARLLTTDGYHSLIDPYDVGQIVRQADIALGDLKCQYCGKQYKQAYWLGKHEAKCPKK